VNWLFTLIIALVTPTLLNALPAGTFYIFTGFNLLAVLVIFVFMKETKGKTDEEVKNLYRK
jgi:SP family arabinose:H+ symporter-like MFS transporter